MEHVDICLWKAETLQTDARYVCWKLPQAHEESAAAEFLRHLQILNGKKLLRRT